MSFGEKLDQISRKKDSRVILALDLGYRKDTSTLLADAKKILGETAGYICAVKMNYHLLLPLSIQQISSLNDTVSENDLVSIADLKLNDIDNTNKVATEYLWQAGFSGVIVNPFAGYAGALDAVFEAREPGKGVITLAYMSHRGAEEGYGLKLENGQPIFEEFLKRAKDWGADGVIVGTTRPEKIQTAREILPRDLKVISPGSGAQGGDAQASLDAGADYLIFGRAIVESEDPGTAARNVSLSLKGRR